PSSSVSRVRPYRFRTSRCRHIGWIRFLAGNEPYARGFRPSAHRRGSPRHDFVHGELPIGDRGGRGEFLATYKTMQKAPSIPNSDVVKFVRHRSIYGRGIGWIDAHLLAAAIVAHCTLWTADRPLAALAHDLGAAYQLR